MSMKRLKFAQSGYENYTGPIGMFEFVDGLSTEPINRVDRDRLCTAFQFIEVDEDGNEEPSGVAHRLVAESAMRAEVYEPTPVMTEEDLAAEQAIIASAKKDPIGVPMYDLKELEAIASKSGIPGLRKIAEPWQVKNRSINGLIAEILAAQSAFQERTRPTPVEEAPADAPAVENPAAEDASGADAATDASKGEDAAQESADKAPDAFESIADAAASGDLSAALTGDAPEEAGASEETSVPEETSAPKEGE